MAVHTILLWLLFIILASLLHLLLHKRTRKENTKHTLAPGPKKLPIIGNLHQVGAVPHRSFWLLSQKHGPLMHLQLGSMPTLVVSSAEMAKEVLKTHDLDFCSRPKLTASTKLTYNCSDIAFVPYSSYWREMRKLCILELFSVKRVESFRFIREEEVSRMIQSIVNSSHDTINLSNKIMTLSNAAICRVALGKEYKEGEYEKSWINGVLVEVQALLGSFYFADFFPSLGWIDKLRGIHGRLDKIMKKLDAFYEEVVDEHLDAERRRPEHEDIVDVLLRLQKDAGHLTRVNIKAVITNMFVAGTDSTSSTIIWAMTELIRNPGVMKKAQEEVRSFIGPKGRAKEEDLHQLQYLKLVVKETLRMHLPAPLLLPREAARHCKIGGYDVLPNTRVFVNAWAIGRDPKIWENAEEFIPERFMNNSMDFKGHDFEFIPFGSGRRICPAMYSGIALVELAIANLLYSFDWALPDGMRRGDVDMNEAPGVAVHKKCALQLVAKAYNMN